MKKEDEQQRASTCNLVVVFALFTLVAPACLCVKVSMNLADGHQKELNTLLPGACFGESVLMTANDERIANVTAVKPSRSWVLERFGFEEQILERSAGSWKEQFLKGVDLFYRLTAATVRGLAAKCTEVTFTAGRRCKLDHGLKAPTTPRFSKFDCEKDVTVLST